MRRVATLAAALLLPALVGGCALDSDPAADSLGRALAMEPSGNPDLISFNPEIAGAPTIAFSAPVETEFEVSAPESVGFGSVNISFTSEGNHNLALTGPGMPRALLWGDPAGKPEKGLTHSVRLRLGTYTYYCSVPGHRNAGMRGTLEVNAFGITVVTPSPTPAA